MNVWEPTIRREDFSDSSPGRLVPAPLVNWAFVPNPLPTHLELDSQTVLALADAATQIGRLAGIGETLPNPHLLISSFVRTEAVSSSRIEGTTATLDDLLMYQVDGARNSEPGDVQEVSNYVRAMEHGIERLASLPPGLTIIREIHEHLMRDAPGNEASAGQFRAEQTMIGQRGFPHLARYVPPPVPEMHEALAALESFLRTGSDMPALTELSLIHYQFEAIHPFTDGNGRVGRILIPLLLHHGGILIQPLLHLSPYLERNRDHYVNGMLYVSQTGDWMPWVRFFLCGISEQAMDATSRSRELMQLWSNYRDRMQTPRGSVTPLKVIDYLFISPVVTRARVQAVLRSTPRTAQIVLDKLVDSEILERMPDRGRRRYYRATEIMDVLERPFNADAHQRWPTRR